MRRWRSSFPSARFRAAASRWGTTSSSSGSGGERYAARWDKVAPLSHLAHALPDGPLLREQPVAPAADVDAHQARRLAGFRVRRGCSHARREVLAVAELVLDGE